MKELGIRERHYGEVTRVIDFTLGSYARGKFYFKSETLSGGIEYPIPIEVRFPLAGPSGEGFFWVPQVGSLVELEIDKANEHALPKLVGYLYNTEDDIAEEFKINYPYRMGFRSRSGHIWLWDTLAGQEFTSFYHPSGTGFEVDFLGNEKRTVKASLAETSALGSTYSEAFGATLKLKDGRVGLGSKAGELLDLISQSLEQVDKHLNADLIHQHFGNLGYLVSPVSDPSLYQAVILQNKAIKAIIDLLKGGI